MNAGQCQGIHGGASGFSQQGGDDGKCPAGIDHIVNKQTFAIHIRFYAKHLIEISELLMAVSHFLLQLIVTDFLDTILERQAKRDGQSGGKIGNQSS